jgi:hypothetical protein
MIFVSFDENNHGCKSTTYSFTESAKPHVDTPVAFLLTFFLFRGLSCPIYSFALANAASPSLGHPSHDSRQSYFLQGGFKDTNEQ